MNQQELQRFVDEARNIVNGYVGDNLPDDVYLSPAEDVIVNGPLSTVIETSRSVSVRAWISIPKTYFEDHDQV